MVLSVSLSRANRPGAVLAVFFAMFFAGAPLICLQLCHLRHREDATTLVAAAPSYGWPSIEPASVHGHGHSDAGHAAADQPAGHSANYPFLAEMQRLLQSLVEGTVVLALVFWPLASRPVCSSPLPAVMSAALEVRQPPPRACFAL